ncbi:macro domain containing protein [Tupanvirus deep ocean]|uniref:Macro domain containing protein n=2 Tax=Tupanvirus TaxID=2094720 RepID=A0AC62AA77_9VIRU|nr:macro domain containing protein [Tupanvirus deep ocean]QKU34587.1 macro domain containing protein [Tupanvirus deep ocean]
MLFIHHIIFFDSDSEIIDTYKNILINTIIDGNLSFENGDFENMLGKKKIHIAISPANSRLSMTGGIDKTYADLFPNIENSLRNKMIEKKYATSDIEYKGTNYILPLGKVVIAETGNKYCHFIMASPTMDMPRDISGSDNVYLCMKTIIKKLCLIKEPIIVACPCLGTGIGNMTAEQSAQQIKKAIKDVIG